MSSSYAMHKLLLGKLIFATVNQDLCMQCLKYNTVISILMQYKNNGKSSIDFYTIFSKQV
jgi:hypothetical protein